MLKGRNDLLALFFLSVFGTRHLLRSTVFHIVVPEVKPNIILPHANDLGLFMSATPFSIANYSGKLCFMLVENVPCSVLDVITHLRDLLDA